ncbi:MAG: isoprenoid biosynthesis glyoxalase ElbB [Pseudomonadales bacterium]
MTKVAVVLSGCGVFDGSEIYESVITLLRLSQEGADYQCFAPDIEQMHVVNHLSGEVVEGESRNVLVEAARLARGEIKNIVEARVDDFDALIVPGGFGAAKNLSDFAVNGAGLSVQPDFLTFAQAMHKAGKPIGLMCIAPTMSAKIFGAGVQCTIGSDEATAAAISASGGEHVDCKVNEIVIDQQRQYVTTPAYMLASSIAEAASGINKLVDEVLKLA